MSERKNANKSSSGTIKRIAAYIRVSTQRQAIEGDSIDAQHRIIERGVDEHARLDGWENPKITYFVDAGRSAKDLKRPQLRKLQDAIKLGDVDVVIVWKLDRITRSILNFAELWELFKAHNVEFVSLLERFDTSSPMGRAMLQIIMVFAELERELTGERTTAVMRERAEKGLHNGGWIVGYKSDPNEKGRLLVDEEWAQIVRRDFFDAVEKLGSAGAVMRRLNELGFKTPTNVSRSGRQAGGKPFSKQQVIRILRNKVYLGYIVWGDVVRKDAHEPIVDQGQFDRVARLLARTEKTRSNGRYTGGRSYPLAGLVRCGHCGAMMTPKGATGRKQAYHYYECSRKLHFGTKACSGPRIPALAVEQAVIERLVALGDDEKGRRDIIARSLELIEKSFAQTHVELDQIRNRQSAVQAEIANLLGVLKKLGESGITSVAEELKQLEDEKQRLALKAEELATSTKATDEAKQAAKRFVREWTGVGDLLKQAESQELKTLLPCFVEVVELKATDENGRVGTYGMRLLSDAPTRENGRGRTGDDEPDDEPEGGHRSGDSASGGGPSRREPPGPLLTENGLVRRVDEKAPRVGLEPTT